MSDLEVRIILRKKTDEISNNNENSKMQLKTKHQIEKKKIKNTSAKNKMGSKDRKNEIKKQNQIQNPFCFMLLFLSQFNFDFVILFPFFYLS